jgi:hypothetical protein
MEPQSFFSTNILNFIFSLGVPASCVLLTLFFTNKISFSKAKDMVRKMTHDTVQTESKNKIESITHNQTKVIAQIDEHEEVAAKVKEKIQVITNKAAEDIEKIKTMENIEEVDQYIDDKWGF